MEENNQQKAMDAFTKKYLKEIALESPSKNFTLALMKQIEAKQKTVFVEKPLISKKGWFAIFSFLLMILLFPLLTSQKSVFQMPKLDFSFLSTIKIDPFFQFLTVSNTTFIAFILFGGMLIFQLIYLKNYFDKRLE